VQRLFSTFPDGWPGTGLVFLRAVTAIPLVQFIQGPAAPTLTFSIALQLLAAGCSALLMVGLWTPIAGLFLAGAELSLLFLPLQQFVDAHRVGGVRCGARDDWARRMVR
jgi:hypothetical protein